MENGGETTLEETQYFSFKKNQIEPYTLTHVCKSLS